MNGFLGVHANAELNSMILRFVANILQVDLGTLHDIYAVVTKGNGDQKWGQWVTAYNLVYRATDAVPWKYYSAESSLAVIPKVSKFMVKLLIKESKRSTVYILISK